MDQMTLRAEPRAPQGSRAARRLRRDGAVPAVVYGRDLDPITIAVDRRALYAVLHTEAGLNALINLEVDGAQKVLTVAREVRRHPVRGDIVHLDFIKISLDEKIAAEVAIDYQGTPAGVEEGGVVETIRTAVHLRALPMDIPDHVSVDVSAMVVGDTLKVADLPAIENVEYLDDPDASLVTVVIPRIVEEPEPEVEEELEEGVEVEGEVEGEPAEGVEEGPAEESAEEEEHR